MPIVTLRQSDPTGELASAPDQTPKYQDTLDLIGGVLALLKKRKQDKVDEAFRSAATEQLKSGSGDVGYEYDPKNRSFKFKVEPKKEDSMSSKIQRFITSQQFGVDPVTGEPIKNPIKPKFGYSGNLLAQIFGGAISGEENANDTPDEGSIEMPAGDGGNPSFLDPLDLEAQNAIAAGKDPELVKKRLAELKAAKKRGSV